MQHNLQSLEHGSNLDVHQQMKLWYRYTMEYYSAIKMNTFKSVLMRWMNLEPIIQSEVMVLKNLFTGKQWRKRQRTDLWT